MRTIDRVNQIISITKILHCASYVPCQQKHLPFQIERLQLKALLLELPIAVRPRSQAVIAVCPLKLQALIVVHPFSLQALTSI